MSEHPNVATIDRMTKAVFENDLNALGDLFTGDVVFHVRGPLPMPGDYHGADGFLSALGTVFELTDGDVKIEKLFCTADESWATEWERAHFGRNGDSLEAENAFIYRFEGTRIAEIWMICSAPAGSELFWN
ncbi:MAG: nuclear transport factor 2 family protein [Acidimicrobiales bacterium]